MSRARLVGLALVASLAAIVLAIGAHGREHVAGGPAPAARAGTATTSRAPATSAVGDPAHRASRVLVRGRPARAADGDDLVRIDPAAVLATVGGVALRGADLQPVRAGEALELSTARLDALLERAIERELVLQAARARGVTLGDGAARQLDALRERLAARDPAVLAIGRTDGDVDFRVRDALGLLYAQALLRADGRGPVTEQAELDALYDELYAAADVDVTTAAR